MKLKELKATDFRKDQKYNFLFPVGATEQHGPFIPFGTDTYIIELGSNLKSWHFETMQIIRSGNEIVVTIYHHEAICNQKLI